jgi:predicted TIM-barrel fold metal-dependent hydrolase
MLSAICHQVPSMAVVMHHLGLFYYWHVWNMIPQARIVCR